MGKEELEGKVREGWERKGKEGMGKRRVGVGEECGKGGGKGKEVHPRP